MVDPKKAAEHPVMILQVLGAGEARDQVHFPVWNDAQHGEMQ